MERLGIRIVCCAIAALGFVALASGRVPARPVEQVLYQFTGGSDGGGPMGRLALDTSSGNLYGTTHFGGITTCGGNFGGGCGVVFQLSRSGSGWAQTPLHAFSDGADGGFPNSGVVLDGAGNLYGTASTGGSTACSIGCGVAYELVQASGTWTERVVHTFLGSDGQFPNAALESVSGALYGTTWYGGAHGAGTVFRLTQTASGGWMESLLYSFNGTQDGSNPAGSVVADTSGNVFGTTYPYNGYNDGVAFKLTPRSNLPWKERVIDAFGSGSGGEDPYSGLIIDSAGNLYGTTIEGGTTGNGVVFKLEHVGGRFKKRILHTFAGQPDGSSPYAGLTQDSAGNLYGAALFGGAHNFGAIFELVHRPAAGYKERILYSFSGGNDGANPKAEPILDSNGNLYGTTEGGGQYGQGVAYEITP